MQRKSIIFCLLIVILSGCTQYTGNRPIPTATSLVVTNFNPNLNSDIVKALKSPTLNLQIQTNLGHRIETGGREYEGEVHGLLWWKHHWQEKTHFTIIIRSHGLFREDGLSSGSIIIEVYAQTYHRKNSSFEWEEFDTDKNSKRASEVLNIILSRLGNNNVS